MLLIFDIYNMSKKMHVLNSRLRRKILQKILHRKYINFLFLINVLPISTKIINLMELKLL